MKSILVGLGCILYAFAIGQVNLSVDRTEIIIGDQLNATITIDAAREPLWLNRDAVWPDSIPGIEIVSGPETKTTGTTLSATWTLACFDTGYVMLPAVGLVFGSGGNRDTVWTQHIPIKVSPVAPDSMGLADIKDIYHHPFNPAYYIRYIPYLLIALALTALYWYWWKRRKRTVVETEVEIVLLPHEWAFKALDQLAEQKLWQCGEIKAHYSQLTGILREYLERRFGIHAMEQTSNEILAQLKGIQLSPTLISDTSDLLSAADLIKFAKADPGMDMHAATTERVRRFVRETIPAPVQHETDKDTVEDVDR